MLSDNKLDCSISTASDDEAVDEYDNIELRAVFNGLRAAPGRNKTTNPDYHEEDCIGNRLIDRKRLRIFANITEKKSADANQ